MSRLLLTTMLWHFTLCCALSQDASIFNQVVSSTGNMAVQQGIHYTYTVGEVVINTVSTNNRTLTQGFHQPEQTQIVYVREPDLNAWNLEVFPNPVADRLTVRFSADQGRELQATVVDAVGKIVFQNLLLSEPDGSPIECRSWQPGIYFLVITDPISRATTTTRIIRL